MFTRALLPKKTIQPRCRFISASFNATITKEIEAGNTWNEKNTKI
jgi:hypothetical protein